MVFMSKIDQILMEKVGCSSVHSKNRENSCRGTPIVGKNQIFCKFGGPRGDPKIVKTGRAFWQKTVENNGPFKNIQCFDLGVTLMGFWLNFSTFGGPKRVPRRSFLATFPPPHHLPHSLYTSSQNPFKLYTFNPTQPQNEPTTPNPKANLKSLYPHTSTSSKPASFTKGLGGMRVAA